MGVEGRTGAEAAGFSERVWFGRTRLGVVITAMSVVSLIPAVAVVWAQGAGVVDWVILGGLLVFVVALPQSMATSVWVREGDVTMRFWWFPRARVEAAGVEGLEVVSFDPLRDFGGWGLKLSKRHGRVYCAAGTEGVRFRSGSRRYVVASGDAAGLALAIVEAGAPAPATLDPVSVREPAAYERGAPSG